MSAAVPPVPARARLAPAADATTRRGPVRGAARRVRRPASAPAEADLLARLDGALPLDSTDAWPPRPACGRDRWRPCSSLDARPRRPRRAGRTTARTGAPARRASSSTAAATSPAASPRPWRGVARRRWSHGRRRVDRRRCRTRLRPRPRPRRARGSPVVDPRRGDLWLARRPHLPVTAGRTAHGRRAPRRRLPAAPCLWCLDRHRADRDEAWPTVMSQAAPSRQLALVAAPEGPPRRPRARAGPARRRHRDAARHRAARGHPPPPGVSVEVSLPWPRMDHRRWPTHPLCPGHPAPPAPEPAGRRRAAGGDEDSRCGAAREPLDRPRWPGRSRRGRGTHRVEGGRRPAARRSGLTAPRATGPSTRPADTARGGAP